jgi:hypothetical protein
LVENKKGFQNESRRIIESFPPADKCGGAAKRPAPTFRLPAAGRLLAGSLKTAKRAWRILAV